MFVIPCQIGLVLRLLSCRNANMQDPEKAGTSPALTGYCNGRRNPLCRDVLGSRAVRKDENVRGHLARLHT